MRHITVILAVLLPFLATATMYAQTTVSIWSFSGKSPEQIKETYGVPVLEDLNKEQSPFHYLEYKDFHVSLEPEDNMLVGFETDNPRFVFLTGLIDGGVKVGDKISKLAGIEKKVPEYNRSANALKTPKTETELWNHTATHIIFEDTQDPYLFYVVNGTIKAIGYYSIYL